MLMVRERLSYFPLKPTAARFLEADTKNRKSPGSAWAFSIFRNRASLFVQDGKEALPRLDVR